MDNNPQSDTELTEDPNDISSQLKPGDIIKIPVEGALGLLALGAVGLKAWRDVKQAHLAKLQAEAAANQDEEE